MRMIFQIAKAELRNLFYSPVAWFLTIAFLFQCAWVYMSGMYPMVKSNDYSIQLQPGTNPFEQLPLTILFYLQPGGLFQTALNNLYLYLPLLTMAFISREVNSGTFKLIYSSPVMLRQFVLGKYLALIVYNMVLVGVIGVFMVTGLFNIKSLDYGLLLSAALGFYLLTCTYGAIGLFMSSLSRYPIISALGTFSIIFILSSIRTLWQHIPFVQDLTYFLHMQGHTEKMLKGLISTKDLIYFLVIIYMFLGFTLIRLRNARERKPWFFKFMRTIVVIVSGLLIGYCCSLPYTTFYFDTTAIQVNTLKPETRALINEIGDEPLEVTMYVNLLGPQETYGLPNAHNSYLENVWEPYLRFKPGIKFKYEYYFYYDTSMDGGNLQKLFPGKTNEEMARDMAKLRKVKLSMFKDPDEIKSIVDLSAEGHRLVLQLKYKDRKEWLRTYLINKDFPEYVELVWPSEMNIAATFKRLVHPEIKPLVLFSTGHYERDINKDGVREYFNIRSKRFPLGLINLGFDFDTIALAKEDIPNNTTALVIADPRSEFSAVAQEKLQRYVAGGGNLVIIGEPEKQHIVNPLLKQLGVELLDGIIVEPTFHNAPNFVNAIPAPATYNLGYENAFAKMRRYMGSKYFIDTAKVPMVGVAAIAHAELNGFDNKPFLQTNGYNTWIKTGGLATDSAAILYRPEEGDEKKVLTTALQMSRKIAGKQQRIAIIGDADFSSNRYNGVPNAFLKTIVYWLSDNNFPVYFPQIDPPDNKLIITGPKMKLLSIFCVWVLPGLLALFATVYLIRRNRK